MMKYFIVILALLAVTNAEEESWKPKTVEEMRKIRGECLEEHPLTEDQMERMRKMDFPDEEAVRQYLLCSAIKMNIFSPETGYYADRVAKQFKMDLDEAEVLEIVKGCVDTNEQKSPTDAWAFRVHKCVLGSKVGDKVRGHIKRREEAARKAAEENKS